MAYVTGTANSFSDLLAALQSACTANGWTLSGNVLHKGSCYAEVMLNESAYSASRNADSTLSVRAGNGIDGSNALTDAALAYVDAPRMGIMPSATPLVNWDWPVTYHVHVLTSSDEVYLRVNYGGGQLWQELEFGVSPAAGNAGTGNWASASMSKSTSSNILTASSVDTRPAGGVTGYYGSSYFVCAPFFWDFGYNGGNGTSFAPNSHMHGALDATTGAPVWSNVADNRMNGDVGAAITNVPLYGYTPNAWNNEAVLFPVQITQVRPSAKISMIGELGHLRYIRNDFITDGQIITLGSDKWKVYPMYRKNAAARDGGAGVDHSGTMATAVRYDGP